MAEAETRRGQRTLRLDVAWSMYDDLEAIAEERDQNLNGVIYQAIRDHIDDFRSSQPLTGLA